MKEPKVLPLNGELGVVTDAELLDQLDNFLKTKFKRQMLKVKIQVNKCINEHFADNMKLKTFSLDRFQCTATLQDWLQSWHK